MSSTGNTPTKKKPKKKKVDIKVRNSHKNLFTMDTIPFIWFSAYRCTFQHRTHCVATQDPGSAAAPASKTVVKSPAKAKKDKEKEGDKVLECFMICGVMLCWSSGSLCVADLWHAARG